MFKIFENNNPVFLTERITRYHAAYEYVVHKSICTTYNLSNCKMCTWLHAQHTQHTSTGTYTTDRVPGSGNRSMGRITCKFL